MKVTIKDIADEANVSIATVSRVINGKDKVKEETRLKILKTIGKHNYQPDQTARTMVMKETKTIGLIVGLLSNEYWGRLAEIIQEALWERGYSLIIGSDNMNQDKQKVILNSFKGRKVDGVIITTELAKSSVKQYEEMKEEGVEFISASSFTNINCVSGDNLLGAIDAVQHLIGLGHRDIVFIGGARVTRPGRELGYKNALFMNNIEVNNNLMITSENIVNNFSDYGYNSVIKLIKSKKKFTAVFCANDLIAIGAMKAFYEKGIKVPEEVAIVGFDDISIAALYQPSLTTVRQPIEEMGITMVDLLIGLIKDQTKSTVKKLMFPMELIVRESCGSKSKSIKKH